MTSSDSPKVEFVQYHLPAIESGVYRVNVKQSVSGGAVASSSYATEIAFAVTGERFSYLATQDVFGVFPAAGHVGDYQNVLPHVTLTRSTLPWERMPDGKSEGLPWLVLLLLRDSDFARPSDRPQPKVITLQELQRSSGVKYPQFDLEPGQDLNDKVTVIDVKKSLLAQIVPRKSDLAYLAHVRQPKDGNGNPLGDELATVLCNRLPQNGGGSTAYLVSVEGRYPASGDLFDYQGAGDADLIRLVCLQSFPFSCPNEPASFTQLLAGLDHEPSTLRLAASGNSDADGRLSAGYVAMPHKLRQGDRTVSWYRGPLAPGSLGAADQQADVLSLPVRAADAILRYDSGSGMFDVSYAAAWELGRLLTLQNKGLSTALYNWKRSTAQSLAQDEQAVEHLPLDGVDQETGVPDAVATWFRRLSLLQGVPFNYLVPDERLLPVESIRFFRIDPDWVECLLDGAFSIGRVTGKDMRQDKPSTAPYANLSGFLLRSSVVSGWPGLIVDGYDQAITDPTFVPGHAPLSCLRIDRLSPNVLFCLFEGEVKTVDIHLAPETMHFGVDSIKGDTVTKTLRGEGGKTVQVPWLGDKGRGVIDIAGLVEQIKAATKANPYTSAQFALDMVEGVQKVRLVKQGG